MSSPYSLENGWLQELSQSQPTLAERLARNPEEQRRLGYFHTLREICQQPSTWIRTAELMQQSARELSLLVRGISNVVLSGSGSSEFAGDCVRMVLQRELGVNVQAIAGGLVLTHGSQVVPVGRPGLMVSIARSGDSPESVGALALALKTEPQFRHLVLTCNRHGSLANRFREDPRVTVIALDDRTNDRSLVMTSSFTNLVIAARFLGLMNEPARYLSICNGLSHAAAGLLRDHFGTLDQVGKASFRRVLFLGSGPRFAVAREAALKMLEMTSGRVTTSCETYLGLRHGPMSAVNEDTLIVCFLSTEPQPRAYESDVLRELAQKQLGLFRLLAGKDIPKELACAHDVMIPYQGSDEDELTGGELTDDNVTVLDAVVGQVLAFARCLKEGLQPDSPSRAGVIQRVVQSFALHLPS
jgi:tagatose-6-phosphate ketose/aldose isomerase